MRRLLDGAFLFLVFPIIFILLFLAILIKLTMDGSPVFYNSVRLGRNCNPFLVFKFRTMKTDRVLIDNEVKKYSDGGFESIPLSSSVYTRTGKLYERLQIVETPQIFNIIRGEMSFVGYRPLPASHYDLLVQNVGEELANLRFSHQPGITGMAQLFGKSNLSYMQRVKVEINEGVFYESHGLYINKFFLYVYSLVGTVCYLFLGRTPMIELVYKHVVIKNIDKRFH